MSFLEINDSESAVKVSPYLQSIGLSGIQIAEKAAAKAIIVYTESGGSPIFLSKYRPRFPIIAVTPNLSVYYRLALEWGYILCLPKSRIVQSGDIKLVSMVSKEEFYQITIKF